MYRSILSLAAAIGLVACANTPDNTARPAAASVSALEASLAASGQVIMSCYAVPHCASVAPKPKIKAAYDAAYNSVTQAQTLADAGGKPDMVATAATTSALEALVAQLPVQQIPTSTK
jgi:DNA-directed RNA polymerase subunit L